MSVRGFLSIVLAAAVALQDKPTLPAEPDANAQKEKLRLVKDLFKDEYGRKAPQDQQALARQLLNRGAETQDDPVARWAMLKEAREVAAACGDVETVLRAVDELAKSFAVQPVALKLAALAKAAGAGKDVELARNVGRACLALVPEAVKLDDYESAAAAASRAEFLGKAAQDPVLPGKAQEFQRDLSGLKSEYQKVKAELEKPAPADPEAVGRYLCFVRGAWEPGLLHLSAGAKPPLRTLVEKDLGHPTEPERQLETADGWWEAAQKEKSPWRKARIVSRAQHWYEQAASSATGLMKVKVDKRLAEIEESQPGQLNLVRLIDLKQEPYGEWSIEGRALSSPADPYTRVLIPYAPPDEFDLTAVVERQQGTDAVLFGFVRGSVTCAVWIEGFSNLGGRSGLELVDGTLFDKNPASVQGPLLANGKPSTVVISVRKSAIVATVDGRAFVNFQGNFSRMNGLNVAFWKVVNWKGMYVGTCGSRYRITKLALTPISGQGRKLR